MGNWRSDLKVKVGTFNREADAASGNTSVSDVGFQPRALIVFMAQMENFAESSFGLSDGTTDGAVLSNAGFTLAFSGNLIDFNHASGSTDMQRAVLSSFDSNGFTLTWTKTGTPPAETLTCIYMALG